MSSIKPRAVSRTSKRLVEVRSASSLRQPFAGLVNRLTPARMMWCFPHVAAPLVSGGKSTKSRNRGPPAGVSIPRNARPRRASSGSIPPTCSGRRRKQWTRTRRSGDGDQPAAIDERTILTDGLEVPECDNGAQAPVNVADPLRLRTSLSRLEDYSWPPL